MVEHTPRRFDYGSVGSLSHTIVLRSVGRRDLPRDATVTEIGVEFLIDILPSTIRAETLQSQSSLPLRPSMVLSECLESITLQSEQLQDDIATVVIDEDDKVAGAMRSGHTERSA